MPNHLTNLRIEQKIMNNQKLKSIWRLILTLLAWELCFQLVSFTAQAQISPPPPTLDWQTLSMEERQALIDHKGYHWTAGETSVSNLSLDERKRLLGLASVQPSTSADDMYCPVSSYPNDYPSALDWRNRFGHDWTTAIRSQASCGSCAAFASAAAIESRLKIAHDNPDWWPDLSEAHLFFCGGGDCVIGWTPPQAFSDAQSRGVVDEACYPYEPYNQPCNPCADWQSRVTKIDCHRRSDGDARIKQELADYGPLVTSMNVYADFHDYAGGIYAHTWGELDGGHAVMLVGYDDAGGYWIAKNSWSTNWGEDGWFRIAYGECGIGDYGFVPVIDRTPPDQAADLQPWAWTGPYTDDPSPSFAWTKAHDDWGGAGLDGYYVAIDDATPEGGFDNDWSIDLLTSWTVPVDLPDGPHFIALTSRDKAGNDNPTNTNQKGDAPYYDFVVDTTPPTNPTSVDSGCAAQDGIWQNACTDPTFTWTGADDNGGSGVQDYHIYWGTDPSGQPDRWLTDSTFNPSPINTGTDVITYYLRLSTRDNLDQESDPDTCFTLRYDAAPPWGSFELNEGADLAYDRRVHIKPSGSDVGSGIAMVHLSNDGENWQAFDHAPTLASELPLQDHTLHTVYLRLADAAGNLSPVYEQAICLDMTPPPPHSANYRLWSAGTVSGGGIRASDSFRVSDTLGPTGMGQLATSTHYRLQSGFQAAWPARESSWFYRPFTCGHSMNMYLPLVLYDVH